MVLLLVYLLVSLEVAVRWQLGLESWRLNWAGRSKMASPPTCVVPRCASTWLISALCVSSSRAFLLMIRVVGVLPCGWLPRAPRCTLFSLPKASVQHWHTSSAAFCREGRHRTRPESGWMQERRGDKGGTASWMAMLQISHLKSAMRTCRDIGPIRERQQVPDQNDDATLEKGSIQRAWPVFLQQCLLFLEGLFIF